MSFQTVDLTAYWVLLFCWSASAQSKQWLSSNHRPHYPHMIKPTRSHAMSLLLIIWCHPLQDSHSHNEVHGHLLDHISTIMIITIIVLIIGYINPPRHPCMPCSFTWLSTASLCKTPTQLFQAISYGWEWLFISEKKTCWATLFQHWSVFFWHRLPLYFSFAHCQKWHFWCPTWKPFIDQIYH